MNESKYARHRSIRKGTKPQLEKVVDALREQRRLIFTEVQGDFGAISSCLTQAMGLVNGKEQSVVLHVTRRPPRKGEVLGRWDMHDKGKPPPGRWIATVAEQLRGDLKLIWDDFRYIAGLRKPDEYTGSYAEYLVVVAIDRDRIDIIFSKYGYRKNHHFFHWQAVSEGVNGVHVDDLLLHPSELETSEPQGFTLL
jgi:hypothetical protein